VDFSVEENFQKSQNTNRIVYKFCLEEIGRASIATKLLLELEEYEKDYIDLAPFYLKAQQELDKVFRNDFKESI